MNKANTIERHRISYRRMMNISFFFRKPQNTYGRRRMKTYELSTTDIGFFFQTVPADTSCVLIEAAVNTFAFYERRGTGA